MKSVKLTASAILIRHVHVIESLTFALLNVLVQTTVLVKPSAVV